MTSPRAILWLLALLAAACGGHGATQFEGSPPAVAAFGACAFCHNQIAVNLSATSSDLKCEVCHHDLTPGTVGAGHRSIPGVDQAPLPSRFVDPSHRLGAEAAFGSCAYCHNQFAVNMVPTSGDLRCEVCHENQSPGVYGPGHRSRPGPERVPVFAGPSHNLGAQAAFGFCADCHNDKAVNMTASGVAVPCQFCHATALLPDFGPKHRSFPGPQQAPSFAGVSHTLEPAAQFGPCGFCHNQLTTKAEASSGHGTLSFECHQCHTQVTTNDYGPGHRSVPACAECHSEQRTHHDTAAGTVFECAVCHTPHGSSNLFLVNENIRTPSGPIRSVRLTNLSGLADGSFASVTHPGTGVCEVCHTTTEFYHGDGTGAQHFPFTCFTCHPHAGGFAPR